MALIGVVLVTAVGCCWGVAAVARVALDRSIAQQAADASALAGARASREEAFRLAAENGASVVRYDEVLDGMARQVHVEVIVGDVAATASARWDPPPPPPPPPTTSTTVVETIPDTAPDSAPEAPDSSQQPASQFATPSTTRLG